MAKLSKGGRDRMPHTDSSKYDSRERGRYFRRLNSWKRVTIYISLTDIAKYHNPEFLGYVIQNWMRNRSNNRVLGAMGNSIIQNLITFDFERTETCGPGNSFAMTPKKWCASTASPSALFPSKGVMLQHLRIKTLRLEFDSRDFSPRVQAIYHQGLPTAERGRKPPLRPRLECESHSLQKQIIEHTPTGNHEQP
ncbi:MAG: hypothetical protein ACLR8L_00300 [Oscillospiraceae bacterium]